MSKEIRDKIIHILRKDYSAMFSQAAVKEEQLRVTIAKIIEDIRTKERLQIDPESAKKIIVDLVDELLGFGPLRPLLEDAAITEIMINGPKKIYIEKNGKTVLSDITFDSNLHLTNVIHKILSPTRRHVDERCPFTDVSLPDGSRVNIVIPPVSLDGPVITIRKFSRDFTSLEDLINLETLNKNMADFLIAAIRAKLNIIFSGATGAGKTTTLNVLSTYLSPQERIITIEDTAELKLNQEHVVRLETKPANIEGKGDVTIRDLFKNTLRMRPSRIILGEVRSEEALDMLQAMSSGHNGSLAVLHASSPEDAISRIETMILLSGINMPMWSIRKQIASSLNLIVQHEQLLDGTRKITRITEVKGLDKENIILQDLFSYDLEGIAEDGRVKGVFKGHGVIPSFFSRFSRMGVELKEEIFR